MTKIEQYKWTIKDAPGVLLDIPKTQLRVDESYQRSVSDSKVLAMSRAWSWIACGALVVASRGTEFYVIDGQHRLRGAMKRADIEKLPCIVFDTEEAKDEAAGFLTTNKMRRAMSSMDTYRAMLVAGDPATSHVSGLLIAAKRQPSNTTSGSTVRCLGMMMSLSKTDRAALDAMWPIITELCIGEPIHERIVAALVLLESKMVEELDDSLTSAKWKKKLLRIGHAALLRSMAEASSFYARGGAKVWAVGVVKALNHGLRNKLALKGLSDAA